MSNLKRYTLYIINIIDIFSCIVSYFLAKSLRFGFFFQMNPIQESVYQKFLLVVIIAYIITNILSIYNDDQYLERSVIQEFFASAKMAIYVVVIVVLFMFATKVSEDYSRIFLGIFAGLLVLIDFILRVLVKKLFIPRLQNSKLSEKIILIGPYEKVKQITKKIDQSKDWRFSIAGIVVTDQDRKHDAVGGIPIISNTRTMMLDVMNEESDSIFLVAENLSRETTSQWIKEFRKLGKPVHLYIDEYETSSSYKKLDQISDYAVITYHMGQPMPKRQALIKRFFDVLFGLCLLPFFLVILFLVWLFTQMESPGRVLYTRVRVGQNGRRFYQYRFRTYRLDAEERMKQDKLPFTIIGFIVKLLHLDGAPELLNVLSSEMSFVGPRAPTLSQYLNMSSKERNNLTVDPGVIGYWSCEKQKHKSEIIQSEQDYISNWSPLKDLNIFLVMFMRYIGFHSTRVLTKSEAKEELDYILEYVESKKPLEYDRTLYQKEKNIPYLVIKRIFDILFSGIGIILLSPILLLIAILVILDDGGTPLYGHQRVGQDGKKITIYKFRSMRKDAGDINKLLTPEQLRQYKQEFKVDDDPRITKFGEFIRKTSLDELPQIFNIFGGSLSIIGPRPIVEEETEIYGDEIGKFLSVKPGLTGYWQAYARNNATYESGERQKMEMYYVDHQSLLLDCKIFFHTIPSVLKREGAE